MHSAKTPILKTQLCLSLSRFGSKSKYTHMTFTRISVYCCPSGAIIIYLKHIHESYGVENTSNQENASSAIMFITKGEVYYHVIENCRD